MALIQKSVLLGIADRAAKQVEMVNANLDQIGGTGGGLFWERVTATDDPDVEIPTLGPYRQWDNESQNENRLLLDVLRNMGTVTQVVTAMDAHFAVRVAGVALQEGSWDGYLRDKDARVSQYFNLLYQATKTGYMLAVNVFSEGDDTFATAVVQAGPTLSWTDGVNYGDGSQLNPADGTHYAATQLRVVVGSMGAADLDLRLSVKDVNDTPTTIDVTVPGGSVPGAVVLVGTGADRFLDVFDVNFKPAGSTGTVGDTVTVRNQKERTIAL